MKALNLLYILMIACGVVACTADQKSTLLNTTSSSNGAYAIWQNGKFVHFGACVDVECTKRQSMYALQTDIYFDRLKDLLSSNNPNGQLSIRNPELVAHLSAKLQRIAGRLKANPNLDADSKHELETQAYRLQFRLKRERAKRALSHQEAKRFALILETLKNSQIKKGEDLYAAAYWPLRTPTMRQSTSEKWYSQKFNTPKSSATLEQDLIVEPLLANKHDIEGKILPHAALSDGTIVASVDEYDDDSVYWVKNGAVTAKFTTRSRVGVPAILSDDTVVICDYAHVYWLKDGQLQHRFKTLSSESNINAPLVLSDDVIVVTMNSGHLYWLKDGYRLFSVNGGYRGESAPVVLEDESIVGISGSGELTWVKDGVVLYQAMLEKGQYFGDPKLSVTHDGTIVAVAGGNVGWFRNGYQTAHIDLGRAIAAPPIVLSDNTVVISQWYKKLFWLRDGEMIHEVEFDKNPTALHLLKKDVVLFQNRDQFYWLAKGEIIKVFDADFSYGTSFSFINQLGEIVTGANGQIYRLKPQTPGDIPHETR